MLVRLSPLALLLPSLTLAACSGGAPAPQPEPPATVDAAAPEAKPDAPAADLLAPIEEEMAQRIEQGKPFDHDEALFDRLLSATRAGRERFPARIWFLFFAPELRAKITEETLQPSKRDQLAFDYLTTVLPPAWSLRVAGLARSHDPALSEKMAQRDACPAPLLAAYDKAREIQGPTAKIEPWRGVTHLFYGSHEETRGVEFARPALLMAKEFMGDNLEGKDLADVGAGSGPSLPSFRAALGPKSKLYAVEVDPFVLQVADNMSKGLDVTPVQCGNADVNLPAGSVDIIVMTGVHMASGLDEWYETETLPWLRAMSLALRDGGILVIDDGNQDLIEEKKDLVGKVERAGFKSLTLRKGAEHPRAPSEWIAVFRVDKNAEYVGPAAQPSAAPTP